MTKLQAARHAVIHRADLMSATKLFQFKSAYTAPKKTPSVDRKNKGVKLVFH